MKGFWTKVKTFWNNIKKLYRLSQVVSFDDSDNTIIFNGNLEAVKDVRAGVNVVCYYYTTRHQGLQEEQMKKQIEK